MKIEFFFFHVLYCFNYLSVFAYCNFIYCRLYATDSVYSFYLTKCLIFSLRIRLYHNAGPWYHVLLALSLKTSSSYKIGTASNFYYRFTFGNQMIEVKTSTFHPFMKNPYLTIVSSQRFGPFGIFIFWGFSGRQ